MQDLIATTLSGRFSGVALSAQSREDISLSAHACAAWVVEFLPELPKLDGEVLVALAGFFAEAVCAPEFLFGEHVCGSPMLLGCAIAQKFLDGLDARLVMAAKSGAEDGTAEAAFDSLYALHGERAFAMVGQV